MLNFKNENSATYKKGILVSRIAIVIGAIGTLIFDYGTIYEYVFRGIWYLALILQCALEGTKEVVAKNNKNGLFYYLLIIVFILVLVLIRY